jgi:hypothetical protein
MYVLRICDIILYVRLLLCVRIYVVFDLCFVYNVVCMHICSCTWALQLHMKL